MRYSKVEGIVCTSDRITFHRLDQDKDVIKEYGKPTKSSYLRLSRVIYYNNLKDTFRFAPCLIENGWTAIRKEDK